MTPADTHPATGLNPAENGQKRSRDRRHLASARPARLALTRALAWLRRPVHRPLDPGENGRSGRARQRRAARPLRRPVGTDAVADRRLPADDKAAEAPTAST